MNLSINVDAIDLTRAVPFYSEAVGEGYRSAFNSLAQRPDLQTLFRTNRIGGNKNDRELVIPWLARRLGYSPSADRIVVANGTQNLVGMVLRQIAGRGGVILAEELTHPVVPPIAADLDITIVPVAIDADGLVPDALREACRKYNPKLIYCNPTIHNPTASVMPEQRRLEIAEISRTCNVSILEDDVVGSLREGKPLPIAALAPDTTWYIQTFSKCFSLGFRVAYLVAPENDHRDLLVAPMGMRSSWFASAIAIEVANSLFRSGEIGNVNRSLASESAFRANIASEILDGLDYTIAQGSVHLWLRLPDPWDSPSFVRACAAAGVLVRPSDMFIANPAFSPATIAPAAVRVAISSPDTPEQLRTGLARLRKVIVGSPKWERYNEPD